MSKNRFEAFAHQLILSVGWRRRAWALAAGAVGALAMPPLGAFPLAALSLTAAVWLIDGSIGQPGASRLRSRVSAAVEAAQTGWWFGFGFFLTGLWWLGSAFLVEADQFAWALPLGVVGLPAVLALYTALGFFLARLIWSTGALRVFALAAGLALSEWLRSVLFTGFPWNEWGMALGGRLYLAQAASVVGLHGLTIICVAIAAAPATLADAPGGWRKAPTALAALALAGLTFFGVARVETGEVAMTPNVRLRLMQPNLPQDAKFRPEAMAEILTKYLELSDRSTSPRSSGVSDFTHLIWPESPFPVILSRDIEALRRIGAFLPADATLITGAARQEVVGRPNSRSRARYFNSIHVIQAGGVITDTYDKTHLVPFGEYLPFGRVIERLGIRQFVHIPGGFEPGRRRALLQAPNLPRIGPLICYEAIFPGAVAPPVGSGERPGLLLNVTNDAWFGVTPGPHQHFAQARLRAIEEGLPLVRAANSGVSAIIDPYGRILGSLPLGQEDVLDGPLPSPIAPTIYARWPTAAPMALWALALLMALYGALQPRRFTLR